MDATAQVDPHGFDVLYLSCALLFALALSQRIYQRLAFRDVAVSAAGWTVTAGFATTCAAFLFAAPAVYIRFDAAIGSANAATLVVDLALTMTGALLDATARLWVHGHDGDAQVPRVARGILVYDVLAVVLVMLFVAGDGGPEEHPLDFDARAATTPYLREFVLLYLAGLTLAMTRVGITARRCARIRGDEWLERALRWMWVGASFVLGYSLLGIAAVLGLVIGAPLGVLSTSVAPIAGSIGAVIMCVGLTMPVWGPRLSSGHRAEVARQVRDYRQLYPLWRALRSANLMSVMEPSQVGVRGWFARHWPIHDAGFRLTRRVIEIMDGRLALNDLMSAMAEDDGGLHRPQSERAAAALEAARICAAINAKQDGATPSIAISTGRAGGRRGQPADELRWLVLVSQEFDRISRGPWAPYGGE